MTGPDITIASFVLAGAGTGSYATVTAGNARSSNTLKLPVGINHIQLSCVGYTGTVEVRGLQDGEVRVFSPASRLPGAGAATIVVPNANPTSWFGVRASVEAQNIGVTVITTPPTT